ncbi:nephronectin a isoform X1 [Dunckerocampus dactyliophorus]|uniref:nephronectin a isoform X1 n=1 Tax=Dunckerocampus dactyliophorus TaxID=161453 RepID=UPI002405E293|nr:nephronectin a isoform X1 [Dunckerocampus dactyliophorus]
MDSWIKFILFSGLWFAPGAEFDGRSVRQMASSNGLCRYGNRVDCCWGWTRQSWGHCQPSVSLIRRLVGIRCPKPQALCQPGCKHGDCVGPNKCKCHAGFTGKTCNQDLNECGLKPRPCKHRCMNTQGSYKCYCLNGYMLMPDGTCGNLRTCGMANCQYGCEVLKGEVRCQCPSPGLQLAPDGRTCVDVDECATGLAVCPRCRKCINTFGSYICKCHDGFDLQYVNGKHQCIDVNECALRPSRCSSFATCYNTRGSYKCKCKDGYRGTGRDCKPIPKVVIEPPRPHKLPPSHHNHIPDIDQRRTTTTLRPVVTQRPALPVAPKTTTATTTLHPVVTQRPALPVTSKTTTTTTILHPVVTQKPALPVAPKVTTITTSTTTKTTTTTKATPTPRRPPAPTRIPERGDNSINWITNKHHRGDVYIPRVRPEDMLQEYEVLLGDEDDELNDDAESGFLSCTFDNGLCGWISDEGGDVHWETTPDPAGGLYLTIPEVGNKRTGRGARLVIPLAPPWNEGNLCLSFRHKLAGHHVGMLQVFIKKGTQYNPSVWESTGGNRWRHTQITLWGKGLQSVVLKGERGRGRSGEMAVDDISVSKGSCTDEFLTPERKRKSSQ